MKPIDKTFVIWFLAVCIFSLSVRLVSLGSVNQVVFDEVHFGKFISSYCCTGERFFDIHPPIGKLIIALGVYATEYSGKFSFDSIGQEYTGVPIASMRIVPALVGALLPIIIFILLFQVGVSLPFAFLGGVAAALDNALVIESRLILTDTILLSATFGALACTFASLRSMHGAHSWAWAIGAGVLSGIAIGTKFTGLTGGALVGVLFAFRIYQERNHAWGVWLARAGAVVALGGMVYLLGWILHFSLLTMTGSGDAWGVPTGMFWKDLVTTHQQMVSANYNLTADHPYGSKWYTWPLMVRSIFYWQGTDNQFIYLLGNPIVWWGSFLLLCGGIASLFLRVGRLFSSGAWIFLFGYVVSFVPLMRVPRVLFLYHYLTPLLFSLLFAIWFIDQTVPPNKRNAVVGSITICVALGFLFMSPLTYGMHLSDIWYKALFFFSSWR